MRVEALCGQHVIGSLWLSLMVYAFGSEQDDEFTEDEKWFRCRSASIELDLE